MTPVRCDVAVVGGGTAGCVVAGRLAAETDAEVVLLEAGPDYGPFEAGRWPDDLLDASALATSHGWEYGSGVLPGREPIDFSRARVMGGCSAHNGCIAAVGCREDYDGWARMTGDDGWGAAAVRPLIARALDRLRVRHYADDEIGPFHRACLATAAGLGYRRADDLDDLDGGVGFGTEPVNVERGVRVNAAFAYLDVARGRPNLRVLDQTLCDRLAPNGDTTLVVGLRSGRGVRIHATTVVLAAGAYGSPTILLRSGVGDPVELARLGIPVTLDSPGVGKNLHDHPLVELELAGSDRLRDALRAAVAAGFVPEEQTLGKLRSSRSQGPYDLHLVPVAAHEHSLLGGRVLLGVAALEPRSRGLLTLRSADPHQAPLIEHGYLTDPEGHDIAVLAEGVEHGRELAMAEPLRSLVGAELVPGAASSMHAAIRRTHSHYFHPVGTCAMGSTEDPLAVCDSAGRVLGLDRVLVADCSLMPVVPRANTNVPAAVVAEHVTEQLLAAGG